MSTHLKWKVQDIRTGQVYETMAKDRIDAKEQVADMYDLDYDQLEVV